MSMTAKAEGSTRGVRAEGGVYREARQALRSVCPQALLNWREARFYGRYGEVELHLLEFLCSPDKDAIDVGANDGSYVHYLRRHARRVIAFEPMPSLADTLRVKFRHGVDVRSIALSDRAGSVELHMPVVDGVTVTGCSTVSPTASATYPDHRAIEVPMATLDSVYDGEVGFIKIDVEGHEPSVVRGALETIRAGKPLLMIECERRHNPGAFEELLDALGPLGYSPYYWTGERLVEVSPAEVTTLQTLVTIDGSEEPPPGQRYVNNFFFKTPERTFLA